jgi:hypothetical protein
MWTIIGLIITSIFLITTEVLICEKEAHFNRNIEDCLITKDLCIEVFGQ